MSSISSHSDPHDFLIKMINLSDEDQKNFINNNASTKEIVELFKVTFKNKSNLEGCTLLNIRHLTFVKINELLKKTDQLNSKQINDIVKICNTALPQVKNDEDDNLETRLSNLFSASLEINEANLGEMIGYAIKLKSQPILDKCIAFVEQKTDFNMNCEDFGLVTLTYEESPSPLALDMLNTCLMGLKKSIEPNNIRVVIDLYEGLELDRLFSFTNENRDLISSLTLRGNDVTDEQLEDLLKNCPNLQTLNLVYANTLDGTGLRGIGLLKKLEEISIIGCDNLVHPPDLQSNDNLKKLDISHCAKIVDPPLVSELTQLEKLTLTNCPSMNNMPDLARLPKLNSLILSLCNGIEQETRIRRLSEILEVDPTHALNLLGSFGIKDTAVLEPKFKTVDPTLYLNNLHHFIPPNMPFRAIVYNELIENDPRQAIDLAHTFSKQGVLPIDDKNIQAFSVAIENYLLPGQSNIALHLAVYINDTALAKKAIDEGADVNYRFMDLNPHLLRACKYGNAEMVNLLLSQGAEAKYLGGTYEHETPLSEARLRGAVMADCLALLTEKDAGFTDEVIGLKLLLHKFSTKFTLKVDGREFSAEGFRPRYLVDDFMRKNRYFYYELQREIVDGGGRIFDSFSEETKSQLLPLLQDESIREKLLNAILTTFSSIEHALDHEGEDIYADGGKLKNEILKDLSEGKPVVCYSVTETDTRWRFIEKGLHAWGLVVMKDPDSEKYLIHRCNRGYGVENQSGVLIGKFDQEQMLEIVDKYQRLSNWKVASRSEAINFFNELEIKLHPDSTLIKQKAQEAGNCCYYSLQAIELALLKGLLHPILGEQAAIACAREIKAIRTSQMRIKDLEDYLESHFPGKGQYPVDWSMLANICEKTLTKSKLYRYNALVQDFTIRVMKSENREKAGEIPQSLVDAVNPYPEKDVQKYLSIRSMTSAEEKLPLIVEMIEQNLGMLIQFRSMIPLKNEELLEIILNNAPGKVFDTLKVLGFSIDEAVTFCMKHQIQNIDLSVYEREITYDIALSLFKNHPDIRQFSVGFGSKSKIHDYQEGVLLDPIQALSADMSSGPGLILTYCNSDSSTLQALNSQFPNLTGLYIYNCKNVDAAAIEVLVTAFPHLNVLSMEGCNKFDSSTIQSLATGHQDLTYLELNSEDIVDSDAIELIVTSFPNLKTLKLENCEEMNFALVQKLVTSCPNLTSLNLSENIHLDSAAIQLLATSFPHCDMLNLDKCNVDSAAIQSIATNCPKLTRLLLTNSPGVNTMTIQALATGCSNLETLNLAGCRNVDATTIQVLKEAFPKLTWLNIRGCNIDSATIEELRSSRRDVIIRS